MSHFSDFGQVKKLGSYFADFKQAVKLWSEKPDAYAFFCLGLDFFFVSIGIQFFNSLTYDLQETMPRQRSLTLFIHALFPTQPCRPSSLTLPCARFLNPFYTFSPASAE